jgi:hypothetical protein
MEKVAPECKKVGVIIEEITVAQLEMNEKLKALADQISERERARVAREKNLRLVEQYQTDQELAATEAKAEQEKKKVEANTKLEREKIRVERQKEVETLKLDGDLKSAQARLEGAKKRAEATITEGKAAASVIMANNEAEIAGLKTAIAGFGAPEQFSQYHVLMKLSPALSEIFASDSSEFAKVFSTYMIPAPGAPGKGGLPMPAAIAPRPADKKTE